MNLDEKGIHLSFIKKAIELGRIGMNANAGGPFGALVVQNGKIIGEGYNCVTSKNDPTAHAEIVAIRNACQKLNSFQLRDCIIYTSCEPCPMCLGAIYWARPSALYYACSRKDAANIGFDDNFIYQEMENSIGKRSIPTFSVGRDHALSLFTSWQTKSDREMY